MRFEYEVKGVLLDASDMSIICDYYNAACTANYLMENYEQFYNNEDAAMNAGYEVRHLMDKHDIDEHDAIDMMLKDPRYNNLSVA